MLSRSCTENGEELAKVLRAYSAATRMDVPFVTLAQIGRLRAQKSSFAPALEGKTGGLAVLDQLLPALWAQAPAAAGSHDRHYGLGDPSLR